MDPSWTYNASLYYRFPTASSYLGALTVALESSAGETLATNSTTISGAQTEWASVFLTLTPSGEAVDTNNSFVVTLDGAEAAGETVHFAMFSLFPPTYKGRENGMRIDIAEVSGTEMLFQLCSRYQPDTGSDEACVLPFPGRQQPCAWLSSHLIMFAPAYS